jgi:hypothetical protein
LADQKIFGKFPHHFDFSPLSFAKSLADCEINNVAAAVSRAFCNNFSDEKVTGVPSEVVAA